MFYSGKEDFGLPSESMGQENDMQYDLGLQSKAYMDNQLELSPRRGFGLSSDLYAQFLSPQPPPPQSTTISQGFSSAIMQQMHGEGSSL